MSQPTRVSLFGKPDCHLCDEAEAILAAVASTQPLDMRKVDIQSSPALFDRYRYRIPVIQVEDGPELDWPTTLERVRRAVLAAVNAR